MTTKAKLPEGTYRVTRDLPAPTPDKRERHDWRKAPIRAGTLFAVRPHLTSGDDLPIGNEVAALHGYSHHAFRLNDPRVADLVAALEPVEETPTLWLLREHLPQVGANILDQLVRDGRLTLDDVKAAYERSREKDNEDA